MSAGSQPDLRIGDVRRIEPIEGALGTSQRTREARNRNVVSKLALVREDRDCARLDLVGLLALDDQAAVELRAPEIAERVVLDHHDALVVSRAGRSHPPQPATQRLLGEDLRLGGQRAQRHDHADVAHVPALAEHEHADDAADRAVGAVDVAGGAAGNVEIVLGYLAVALGVDHEQAVAGEVAKLAEVVAGDVGLARVLAHHEQDRALARGRERLVEFAPAPDRHVEPLAVL